MLDCFCMQFHLKVLISRFYFLKCNFVTNSFVVEAFQKHFNLLVLKQECLDCTFSKCNLKEVHLDFIDCQQMILHLSCISFLTIIEVIKASIGCCYCFVKELHFT